MILETIGLPGSGKTYLCNEIEKKLGNNINSLNISRLTSNIFIFKIIKYLFILLSSRTKIARDVKCKVRLVLQQENVKSSFGIYKDESYSVNMICCFILLYSLLERSKKVYLFDEGIVHTVIKMCADFEFSKETFNSIMNIIESGLKDKNWVVIYNYIDIEECLASIKKRNRHVCAFDELSAHDLRLILEYYNEYNEFYYSTRKTVGVERNKPMNQKIEVIIDKIYNMGVK